MNRSFVLAIKDHLKVSSVFTKLISVIASTFQVTTMFSIKATKVAIDEYTGPIKSLQVKKGVTRLLFKSMPNIKCEVN